MTNWPKVGKDIEKTNASVKKEEWWRNLLLECPAPSESWRLCRQKRFEASPSMSKLSMWLGNKIRTTYEIIIITILNIKGVNAYRQQSYEKRLWFQDVMVLMFICDDNLNIASYCFVCFHLQTIFLESGTEGRIPRVFLTHLKIYSIKGELYFHYFWHCVDSDRKQLFYCDFIPITLVSFMTNANIKMSKRWVR